jgi:hypothetical protein
MARKLEPHDFRCVKTPQIKDGFSYDEVKKYMSELFTFYWEDDEQLSDLLGGIAMQTDDEQKNSMKNLLGSDKHLEGSIDKLCEYYFLAKYGEYYIVNYDYPKNEENDVLVCPVSMHNLMLVHDGWAMGRILTVVENKVVPQYDEGKGKINNELKIKDFDQAVFGDSNETVKGGPSNPGTTLTSSDLFAFEFGTEKKPNLSVKLQGRRVNQMIDFMQLTDQQQGLDVEFIFKFQSFMNDKDLKGLNFVKNVLYNTVGNIQQNTNKKELYSFIKTRVRKSVDKCNWPFTPQCYYYPNWRTETKPLQITVNTSLIVHKSLPYQVTPPSTTGGAPRRRGAAKRTAKDKNKKKSAKKSGAAASASGSPWQSTGRKVTAKDGRKKLVYRNAATGELRVRRVSVNERTGKRVTRYVNF